MKAFKDYETAAISTAIYPGQGTPLGLIYCALKLNGEAGEFAEHLGKALRDDEFSVMAFDGSDYGHGQSTTELTPDRRSKLILELGDVLWYISNAAKELGTSLEEVAELNIEKLASRRDRGALGGSGDNR